MAHLVRGSADWKEIVKKFERGEFDRAYYNANNIWESNPAWKSKYDREAFGYSLRNLVASLYLQKPPDIQKEDLSPPPNHPGVMPPNHPEARPSGAHMVSDDLQVKTPCHQLVWSDSSANQNDRITLLFQALPGAVNDQYSFKVETGGQCFVIEYEWPEEFLSPFVLMADGYYAESHPKIVAFKENVKDLRQGDESQPVKSINRIPLLMPCEEQLATT